MRLRSFGIRQARLLFGAFLLLRLLFIGNTSITELLHDCITDKEHLRQHPHPGAGAKDHHGKWGYIHDAKFLHHHPNLHPFSIPKSERAQICAAPGKGPEETLAAYRRLTQSVQIQPAPLQNGMPVHDNKLFCAVYTHPGASDMTVAALETWGRRCDGFLAASTITDASRGMVEIPHDGKNYGKYNGIWQKVRSMMTYIYEQYGSQYDYFHFNGDDTFVVVENLKAFLHKKRPRYVGSRYTPWWLDKPEEPFAGANWALSQPGFYYPLGGPGYTISAATLRFLVQEIIPVCEATIDESPEDYFVGRCLWSAGIRPEFNGDDKGIDIFNPIGLEWNYISSQSVSFHMIKTPAYMRRFERLLYRRNQTDTDCPQP